MFNSQKLVPAIMGASILLALAATPTLAKDVTLKFANVASVSGKEAGQLFKKIVEEETNGAVKVNLFPDNQLGDDRVAVESTIFGDIDIAVSATSPLATIFSDFYLFDTPYIFLSPEQAYAGLDGPAGKAILESLAGKDLKGLAFWENGFRNFTSKNKKVSVPDDLVGMKVRTMENDVHLAAWKALGASPTPMAGTELFTALQQGTVDAQENSLGVIDGLKFNEVQNYLTTTQHVYTPYVVVMNLDKFNSLTEDQQAIIEKAAKQSTDFQRKRSGELEQAILEKFQKSMTVTLLSPEDKKLWQKKIVDAKISEMVKSKMQHPEYFDQLLNAN
ncbi:DctP family TRAP transporter solute-binding subunit [uncultured Cohaesibacter sp.]|uniref:DctP family TRAP transporter solute-binding subunit n=1 Tax=uncultured Cohaesibacter sp. TaxID=1002546 RepID=UPI00292D4F58|nr:DctP family TRAP transporter solute-binding subunit [uncultured Cohaesibacter sp.]